MTEAIKTNDSDLFIYELMNNRNHKITFKESFLIIEVDAIHFGGFKVIDNKCKKLYDMRKIHGYIIENLL